MGTVHFLRLTEQVGVGPDRHRDRPEAGEQLARRFVAVGLGADSHERPPGGCWRLFRGWGGRTRTGVSLGRRRDALPGRPAVPDRHHGAGVELPAHFDRSSPSRRGDNDPDRQGPIRPDEFALDGQPVMATLDLREISKVLDRCVELPGHPDRLDKVELQPEVLRARDVDRDLRRGTCSPEGSTNRVVR